MLVAISFGPFAVTTARAADTAAPTARADADVARAKTQLAIGQQAYDEARHEDALVAFEAAYAAYPVADFQYNIGLCHERLGHVEAAITAFEAYLAGKPDAPDRATVERRIDVLVAQRPVPSAAVTASVPTTTPPRAASVGDLIDPFPMRTDKPANDELQKKGRRMVTGGAIAFTLGVGIGVGGGVGFGLPAAQRADEPGADDEADRLLALQIASVATGAVLVSTGIGLLVVGKRKQRRAAGHAWIAPTPTGIAIAGRF